MRTQMAEVRTRLDELYVAYDTFDKAVNKAAETGYAPSPDVVRAELARLHQVATDKLGALNRSVEALKQHLKSRPKLQKLVSLKYKNAKAFLERSEDVLRQLTASLANLGHGL